MLSLSASQGRDCNDNKLFAAWNRMPNDENLTQKWKIVDNDGCESSMITGNNFWKIEETQFEIYRLYCSCPAEPHISGSKTKWNAAKSTHTEYESG
jgi:hypothetical protein